MSNVPQFAEGELVNVTIRGARFSGAEPHLGMHGFDVAGKDRRVWLPLDVPGVQVERVAPAEWPPQTGDIWADRDGSEWFGRVEQFEGATYPYLSPADADGKQFAEHVAEHSGPMRLLRRRGWTPAADTAPAAAAQVDLRAGYIAGLRKFADLLETRPDLPVKYPGEVFWLVRDKAQVDEWVQVLGQYQPSPDGDVAVHHWAKGKLGELPLRAIWIEYLPKPPEVELTDAQLDAAEAEGDEPVDGCDCEDCDRVEVGADGCGCPITEEQTTNGASVDGTERTEHRLGCWALKAVETAAPLPRREPTNDGCMSLPEALADAVELGLLPAAEDAAVTA